MPWIPEKYKSEKPDFEYLRKRAEGGFGAHPNQVLWMLDMLEEANILLGGYMECLDDSFDEEKWNWMRRYEGDNEK